LTQKKDIKRAQKARTAAEEEAAKQKAHEDEQDHERAIQDFELTQAGLDRKKKGSATRTDEEKVDATTGESDSLALVPATKRKFELDKDELDRIAREDKVKARKALEDEKVKKLVIGRPTSYANSLMYRLRNRISHPSGPHRLHQTPNQANSHPLSRRTRPSHRVQLLHQKTPILSHCKTSLQSTSTKRKHPKASKELVLHA
jgi:hypothetical protein